MSTIKGIFFDAAGVFYDRMETTESLAARRLTEWGYATELSAEAKVLRREMHVRATEGRLNYRVFWNEVLCLHGLADDGRRAALVQEILDQSFNVFAYPGGREALAGLPARGFKLGVVTDTIYPVEWKMKWLETVGVAEYIQFVACSTDLGAHKPQPEMYLNAVKQAELTPDQSAFVGHDARELAGARAAGLATVAVNYDPEAKADYYAASLPDLLNVPLFAASDGRRT
jgi:putative hydrolase of the HAD superfamily